MVAMVLMGHATEMLAQASNVGPQDNVWVSDPVRIDRSKQTYQRLPSRIVIEQRQTGLDVPIRISVIDSGSFSFDATTYRVKGIIPIGLKRVCHGAEGHRWTCGRMAALFLGNMVRGKRLNCDVAPKIKTTVTIDCIAGTKNIAREIVAKGFGRSNGDKELKILERKAIKDKAGIWENPACVSMFETC